MKAVLVSLPALLGLCLDLVAAVHRSGLSDPGYTTSPLVPVEVALAAATGLLLLAGPVVLVVLALKKQWRGLAGATAADLIGFLALIAAFAIDAPTLLGMA